MTTSAQISYTFYTPYPDILQAGRAAKVEMRVYRDGALVAPTQSGSTFSLYKPDGTVIVENAAVTVTGSVAQYTIAAVDLPTTLPYGEGYQEVWNLVLADRTEVVDREAALCVRALHPPASDQDLLDEYPNLNRMRGADVASFQGFLDSAWKEILETLFLEGFLPYRLKSSWALRVPQRELALAKIFTFFASAQGKGNYLELAKTHRDAYKAAWTAKTFTVDNDDDGRVDDPTARQGGSGAVVMINAAPTYRPNSDRRW